MKDTESPIEETFLTLLQRHIEPSLKLRPQENIETANGRFRVDFLVMPEKPPGLVFECDGAAYHDFNRDMLRDAAILSTQAVKSIWRIPGNAIHYSAEGSLYLVAILHPRLLSARGYQVVKSLALARASGHPDINDSPFGKTCALPWQDGYTIQIERRDKTANGWQDFLKKAKEPPTPPPAMEIEVVNHIPSTPKPKLFVPE